MWEKPLLYLVPAAAAALYCAVCIGWSPGLHGSLLLLALLLAATGATIHRPRVFMACGMLAAAALAFSLFALHETYIVTPVRKLNSHTLSVTATALSDAAVYEDSQRVKLSVDANDRIKRPFRTLCYLPLTDGPVLTGDRIEAYLSFYLPGNTGGFDRAMSQAADGYYIASSCPETEEGEPFFFSVARDGEKSLRWLPARIARYCRQAVTAYLPEREAGLLAALLLGDKTGLSEEDALALRIAGLSHLTAVSGLHVGFLAVFCFLLFGRRAGAFISVPLILLFVPIAGATPSVIRAALMYLIAAGAFVLRREADSLNSLCVALAILLLGNPRAIASLSLQLSFLSTAGLILLAGKMQRRLLQPTAHWPKWSRPPAAFVAGALSCTVCATIFTTPVLLTSFGTVSVLSLLGNLLVTSVTAVCFIGGFLLCAVSACLPPVAALIAGLLVYPLRYILLVANWIADLPFGLIDGDQVAGVMLLLLTFALILLWLLRGRHVRWKMILPAFCVVAVGIAGAGAYYDRTHYTVTCFPCGSGQAIAVSDMEHMLLIDCGGDGGYYNAASTVREWMRWHGIRQIDTLILTAVDKSHARDLPELLEKTAVEELLIPDGCKQTKYNTDLLALVQSCEATTVTENRTLETLPVSVFPITGGKLGVQIGTHTLILHSPTQKQLAAFLETDGAGLTAPAVVLSDRNTSDGDLLQSALDSIQAETILLQAGRSCQEEMAGRPIESPYLTGEIQKRYVFDGE